jgi:hypothetical protein
MANTDTNGHGRTHEAAGHVVPMVGHMSQGQGTTKASGGAGRWLPGIQTLRTYQRSWLPRDVMAGIVLTAQPVPAGMGYAEASGLPAQGPIDGASQPRAIPSTEPDGVISGKRIMRNELNNPTSPARIGTSSAT